jgi:RNA polymerase sigma-70 factor (ECF subfamily)
MSKSNQTDQELWLAITRDDSIAFAVLFERYWKKMFKTVNYYLKDYETSEEVLNDVFTDFWEKRKTIRIESFSSYATAACRYHVFKHLKARKINPILYIEEYTDDMFLTGYCNTDSLIAGADLEIQLELGLKSLPKKCREIFWESRIKHLNNDEIAVNMNISKRTVENQITIALKHLRQHYKEWVCFLALCVLC